MALDAEARLVEIVLSRLGDNAQKASLVTPLATSLGSDPKIDRLPESRLVIEFLNQAQHDDNFNPEIRFEIQDNLLKFFLGLVFQNHQGVDLQAVVKLSGLSHNLSQILLLKLEDTVWIGAAAAEPENERAVLTWFEWSWQKPNQVSDSAPMQARILSILNFLLAYCRSLRGQRQPEVPRLLEKLLPLIAYGDKPVSGSALNLAIALIDSLSTQTLEAADFVMSTWSAVLAFVYQDRQASLVTAGLTIWLRLLSRAPPHKLLASDEYWDALHRIFGSGSPEQQRVCLAIFRVSISLFYKNQAGTTLSKSNAQAELDRYEKFMTVYQVIVLDRYINLIKEVIADFEMIASPSSAFPKRWVFALLSTALSSSSQLSVRRVVGHWVFDHPETLASPSSDDFLDKSFLPWASMGPLFNGSVQPDHEGMATCLHADRFAHMLERILSSPVEIDTARTHLKSLLRFLCDSGRRIFPTARATILEGINAAVSSRPELFVNDMQSHLHEAATVGGFQDVAMDYGAVLVGSIVRHAGGNGTIVSLPKETLQRLETIKEVTHKPIETSEGRIRSSMSAAAGEELKPLLDPSATLHWLADAIRTTQHRCLANQGLAAACELLQQRLSHSLEPDLDEESMILMLSAICEELEVQEWPRVPFITFMKSMLLPQLVRTLPAQPNLRGFVSSKLTELTEMIQGKIYVFTTLAAGFRTLLIQCPQEVMEIGLWRFLEVVARNPPETKPEFLLEAYMAAKMARLVPNRPYEFYYGANEAHGYACIFDTLNMLPQQDTAFITQARSLFARLLEPWPRQELPLTVFARWKSNVQVHVLAILLEYLLGHFAAEEAASAYSDMNRILEIELLPRFRFLFEWMTARIVYRRAELRARVIDNLASMDIGNPKHCISTIKLNVMIAGFADTEERYARLLSIELLLLAGCPKVAIRHEAQWAIPQLWTVCERRGWTSVTRDETFSRMNSSLRETEFFENPPAARMQEMLDPVAEHSLTNLVEGAYLDIKPPALAKTHRRDFLAVWKADGDAAAAQGQRAPSHNGILPLGEPARRYAASTPNKTAPASETRSLPRQIKGRFSLDEPAKIPMSLLTPGNSGSPARPSPLIVVASLVDSHWNLGGICRAAEILGAASVHFATVRVLESTAFTATSVSSHLHVPIEPLAASEVSAFLTDRKREGFEVVGIEQTDSSRVLGMRGPQGARFQADGRTVLVLGAESTGLPGELLADCDWCVEIRQKGITRSMNVHTAAAVVMYEYVRQRDFA